MARRKSRGGQADSGDPPRAKKLRTGEEENSEEEDADDDDEKAKFVHPIDEVGDQNLNDEEKQWMENDAEEGDTILKLESVPAWDDDIDDDVETQDDFNLWMKKLEDLRSKLKTESRGDIRIKPSADELHHQIHRALKSGDWLPVTAAAAVPRTADIISIVKKLSRQETLDMLRALVARHEHPTEQQNCTMWIHQVLDHEPHDLHGTADVRTVLRPLLTSLSHGLGHASQAGQVLGCVVKWRLALGLAKARKAAPDGELEADDGLQEDVGEDRNDDEEAANDPESPDAEDDADDD